jgi:hypothetical protein
VPEEAQVGLPDQAEMLAQDQQKGQVRGKDEVVPDKAPGVPVQTRDQA